MQDRTFKAGETIFHRGEASDTAYLLVSGEAEVLDQQIGGDVRIAVLGKGEILGDMGFVEQRPHSLTARAVTEVRASALTRDAFVERILQQPEQSLRYLRTVFARIRGATHSALHPEEDRPPEAAASTRFRVSLAPATEHAGKTVPRTGIEITRFPYRVGRAAEAGEATFEVNDLLLADRQPYNVSRKHFAIEVHEDGVFVQDRGSQLGTLVNGKVIGGHHRAGVEKLSLGKNEVVAGPERSPFRFRIDVQLIK